MPWSNKKLHYYTLKNHVTSNCYNLKNLKHFFFNTNYLFTTKSVFLYKILLGIHYTEYTRSLVKIFIVNGHFHTPFSFPYLCYIASRNRILVPTKPYWIRMLVHKNPSWIQILWTSRSFDTNIGSKTAKQKNVFYRIKVNSNLCETLPTMVSLLYSFSIRKFLKIILAYIDSNSKIRHITFDIH